MHYRFVHFISSDTNGARIDDTAHGDDGDVSGPATDIDHHVSGRLFDRQSRANGRGHRVFDQINFAGSCAISGVLHRSLFYGSDFAGNTDDDSWVHQDSAVMSFLNKIREHLFGNLEVGDHTVFHGLDGHDVSGGSSQHFPRFTPDGDNFSTIFIDGDDGRLVYDNPLSACKDQRIGSTEIDGQVG